MFLWFFITCFPYLCMLLGVAGVMGYYALVKYRPGGRWSALMHFGWLCVASAVASELIPKLIP